MAFTFTSVIERYLPADVIAQAAHYYGEQPAAVQKGVDAVIPLSLAGILQQTDTGHVASLLDFSNKAFNSGILQNVTGTFTQAGGGIPASSPGLLNDVFGSKTGAVANAVATYAGLKGSTASGLLGTILPLALAVLDKYANDNDLNASAVAALLGRQRKDILAAVPAGIDVTKLLGIPAAGDGVYNLPNPAVPTPKRTNWAGPLILGLLIIIGLWYILRSCNHSPAAKATTDTIVSADQTIRPDTVTALRKEPLQLTLPNGITINAYKGGIEDELISFIRDPNAQPGKDKWFDFNTLNFKFGTAEILPESRTELENIVQILKAYPKVKIKIGGYTDKVGDEVVNKKISQARATAVSKALKDGGVGSQVTGAEGYGSQYAKYAADAPESDRIKDRRIAVSVREK
ncbi:hypothetical protein DCC81_15980 [Chitinophaga parva]|uniref:OmpA-like domain-containing protein n=1 Tax=Chitinophaga parva TaxID=2169414 RepID=A0A2T7BHL0_9BACT|nr:OmpA family protein [Chitinophaga parva]PUZ25762.1 hypothetical protein DCC81_15980 [Chitinophaga parva]